jgi:flagellar biosynthesis anti-sigma factor FlgM
MMRIEQHGTGETTAARSGRADQAANSSTVRNRSGETQTSSGDSVEISGAASQLSRVLATDATRRAERVEKLRLEVHEGKYREDANRISRELVADRLAAREYQAERAERQ